MFLKEKGAHGGGARVCAAGVSFSSLPFWLSVSTLSRSRRGPMASEQCGLIRLGRVGHEPLILFLGVIVSGAS
jgi:hypothetical protein